MVVSALADVDHNAQPSASLHQLMVIGCGNPNRQDDGVGCAVVRLLQAALAQRPVDGVVVIDAGTSGMEVMFAARNAQRLIIVDACQGAGAPGSVYRVPGHELEVDYAGGYSLHDFRWNHALHAGRRMFGEAFPARVEVVLIEAASVALGLELSAAVKHGMQRALDLLLDEIAALQGEVPDGH